jgi:glycosyltransferase involved in cell wall biosynthesis
MKVSVPVVTYNHEPFLGQALESVLAQSTDFDVEIVVGEDCSTDGTRAVLCGYANRYPSRIRLVLHERNLGMRENFLALVAVCRGEYLALLDGDDLWPATHKLRTQVALLDADPAASGCFANAVVIDAHGRRVHDDYLAFMKQRVEGDVVRAESIAPFGISPACTVLFRRAIADSLPEWCRRDTRHSNLDLLIALRGTYRFLPDKLGAYRLHAGGVWTGRTPAGRLYDNILSLKSLYDAEEIRTRFGPVVKAALAGQMSAFVAESRAAGGWAPALRRLAAWAWTRPRRLDLVLYVMGRFAASRLRPRILPPEDGSLPGS